MSKLNDDFARGMSKASSYEWHVNFIVSGCMMIFGSCGFVYFILKSSTSFFLDMFLLFICSGIVLAGFRNAKLFGSKIRRDRKLKQESDKLILPKNK